MLFVADARAIPGDISARHNQAASLTINNSVQGFFDVARLRVQRSFCAAKNGCSRSTALTARQLARLVEFRFAKLFLPEPDRRIAHRPWIILLSRSRRAK
jgi:hypothetical protein